MTQEVKDKIAKVYELVKNGVQGEKEAAYKALDRLMKKYNLNENDIKTIHLKEYGFKYSNNMELMLLIQLHKYFLPEKKVTAFRDTWGKKELVLKLEYIDYMTIEMAYEYFRRHMNSQFKSICLPEINRCRKLKTKNKRRQELQDLFFSQYVLKSKIYNPDQIKQVDLSKISDKEKSDRMKLQNITGGIFYNQVTTGLFLEDGTGNNLPS